MYTNTTIKLTEHHHQRKQPSTPPLAKCRMSAAIQAHFLSVTHGGAFPLPRAWSKYPTPILYSLSSFFYCIPGVLLLVALSRHPAGRVYSFEEIEGWLLILQGFISYKCDVADLAVSSRSHPIDRMYSTALCTYFGFKIILCSFFNVYSNLVLFGCLITFAFGITAYFQASREHLLNKKRSSFLEWTRWIVVWHASVPVGLCVAGWIHFDA